MIAVGPLVLFLSVIGSCVACDTIGMNKCLVKLQGAMSPEALLPDNMLKQCKQKTEIMKCLNRYNSGCTTKQMKTTNMAVDFMNFFCAPRFIKGLKHAENCLGGSKTDLYHKMFSQCDVMKIGAGCKKAKKVVKCTNRYLGMVCDTRTARLYGSLFAYLVHMSNKYARQSLCVLEREGKQGYVIHSDRKHSLSMAKKTLPTGIIIACVLGSLLLVGAVIAVVVFALRRQHRRSRDAFINHDVLARI